MSETKINFCKNSAVNNWLAERNELIVLYCKLTGQRHQQALPDESQITQFCDLLIDYVSAGHFEVYEKIVGLCEQNGPSSIDLLEKLYPQISKTTDIAVDFNDKYALPLNEDFSDHLDKDLSFLGEAIAKRVELEDSLIDRLQASH